MRRSAIPEPKELSLLQRIGHAFDSFGTAATRARKPAGDEPLTIAERIKESLIANFPNLSSGIFTALPELMAKVKGPLLATLGVAAVAGIAYLVYRLYKKYTGDRAAQTVDAFVQDVKASAPDLVAIEGWEDSIRNEAAAAVAELPPAELVEKLAKIKASALEHQHDTKPENVGSGLSIDELKDFIKEAKKSRVGMPRQQKRGGAIRAVM